MTLILHNYFRSSTSTRLRIALNIKGLDYDYVGYSLLDRAHKSPEFLARNPSGLVPVLELPDGTCLAQSLAIIEYLDETQPDPPLLPENPVDRVRVRALAQMIACDIHPVNNLRILQYIEQSFGQGAEGKAKWFRHWVQESFAPFETMLAETAGLGNYCHGETPGLADICLYAQALNNARFNVDMTPYPRINLIVERLDQIDEFRNAAPDRQPDAP